MLDHSAKQIDHALWQSTWSRPQHADISRADTGLSLQPVTEDYDTCQHWVTSPWLKSVWEKASCFNIEIQLAPLPLQPPRERDTWIMAEFLQMGYYRHTLRQLN